MVRIVAAVALCGLAYLSRCADAFAFTGGVASSLSSHKASLAHKSSLRMAVGEDVFVPDMTRRNAMNLILAGSAGTVVLGLAVPYVSFFVPKVSGGGGGVIARDAVGQDVTYDGWLSTHLPGSRELVEGIKGDATYLVVKEDKTIENYGIVAVCTHLGCVVPWNKAENKFICPCHGSQYNSEGKVVRGPAPLSLALSHVSNSDGKVSFTPWTETDFRTNEKPWWN